MAYGILKVDTVTFTDASSDKSVSISGLVKNPTFSGNVTATGTISGAAIQGGTLVSGATVTGSAGQFTTITGGTVRFTTITGITAVITSGVFASGTAAAPSVSVGTTTNGLYSPGANQLAITTSGAGRIFVTSAGNVGIGTTSPAAKLDITATGNGTEILRFSTERSWSWLQVGSGGTTEIVFKDNTGTKNFSIVSATDDRVARFLSSNVDSTNNRVYFHEATAGRVGIGNSSANGTLHVTAASGVAPFIAAGTSSEFVRIDSSGRLLVGTSSAENNFNQTITTGLTPYVQIKSAERLGLSVQRTNGPSSIVLASSLTAADGNSIGQLAFSDTDGTNFINAASITAAVDGTPGANDMPGRLVFSTTADGASSPTEAMRINNQRELLIGTTTRTANGGVLQISNGITFPGTQSACSDPNTLDDYEEGTFTPTIEGTTTAGTGTYTTQNGFYTKIGNVVSFTLHLNWSAHTGTGNLQVAGLPFASSNSTNIRFSISIYPVDLALTAGNIAIALVSQNVTVVALSQTPTGGGAAASIPMDTAAQIIVTGEYRVA